MTVFQWPDWIDAVEESPWVGDNGVTGTQVKLTWHGYTSAMAITDAVLCNLDPTGFEQMCDLAAAAFRRRAMDEAIQRCNEQHGYGWTDKQRNVIHAMIALTDGRDGAIRQRDAFDRSVKAASGECDLGITAEALDALWAATLECDKVVAALPRRRQVQAA